VTPFLRLRAAIGQSVRERIIGTSRRKSTDIPAILPKKRESPRMVGGNVPRMDVPSKLKARRVRVHVSTTLTTIVEMRLRRDAARCRSIDEVSWESLDLYTIALDICEDDGTRELVAQARGTIIAHLMR
jgi:hypothetical protein